MDPLADPVPADPLAGLTLDATDVLLLVGLLAVALVFNNALQKRAVPVPEAISTICVGIAAGGVASLFPSVDRNTFEKLEDTAARQFMLVFIAPIIFAEGYGMKSRQFFENITRILCHAFLGTFISTLVIGAVVYYLPARTGGVPADTGALTLAECLAFGAMISSTDPVTTLAIFKEQQMVENGLSYLYYSVLGESILNDAVAITLFSSFSSIVREGGAISAESSLRIFCEFCRSFGCSTAVGLAGGALTALVLKSARLGAGSGEEEHFYFNVPEIGVALVMAYLPFLVAEALGLSGIVSVMFAGITMRRYAHYNLTEVTRQVFLPFVELVASLCETYVFALLGLGVFLLRDAYSLPLILWSALACLLGRAVQVYPLAFVVNRCSAGPRLTRREQHVVWFAGLRGAVAFMCALGFPENEAAKHRDLFLCTTVVIVGLTIVFLGWPTTAVLRWLDIGVQDDSQLPVDSRGSRVGDLPGQRRPGRVWSALLADDSYISRTAEGLRKLLMTTDALQELASLAGSQQPSSGLGPRPSLGFLADGVATQRAAQTSLGAAAPQHLAAMGGMGRGTSSFGRLSGASQPALPTGARFSSPPAVGGAAGGGAAAAAAAAAAAVASPDEAAGFGQGRPRSSAPPRLLSAGGLGGAGRPSAVFRSARMICDP